MGKISNIYLYLKLRKKIKSSSVVKADYLRFSEIFEKNPILSKLLLKKILNSSLDKRIKETLAKVFLDSIKERRNFFKELKLIAIFTPDAFFYKYWIKNLMHSMPVEQYLELCSIIIGNTENKSLRKLTENMQIFYEAHYG